MTRPCTAGICRDAQTRYLRRGQTILRGLVLPYRGAHGPYGNADSTVSGLPLLQVDRVGCLVQRLVLQELYAPRCAHAAISGAADGQQQPPLLLTGVLESNQGGLRPAHEQEAAMFAHVTASGASSGVTVCRGEDACLTESSAGQPGMEDVAGPSACSAGERGAGAAACHAAALYVSPWRAPDDGHLICRGGAMSGDLPPSTGMPLP